MKKMKNEKCCGLLSSEVLVLSYGDNWLINYHEFGQMVVDWVLLDVWARSMTVMMSNTNQFNNIFNSNVCNK